MGSIVMIRMGGGEVGGEEEGRVPAVLYSDSDTWPWCMTEEFEQGCAQTPCLANASRCPSSSLHARQLPVQWTELASFPMTQLLASFKFVATLAAASAPTPPSVQLGSSRASSSSGLISSSSSDKARYSASAQVDRIYSVVSRCVDRGIK